MLVTTRRIARALAVLAALLHASGAPAAGPIADAQRLDFATRGQGLFGPGAPPLHEVFPVGQLYETHEGPVSQGRIVHDVPVDVPLSVLQSAWQQAMNTCTGHAYTRHIVDSCQDVTIHPTASECGTGHIGTRSLTVTCCALGDAWSNGCSLGLTVSNTYTRNLDIDLGVGIGPEPTQPAPAPFDVGAIATYQADVDVGLEVELQADPGSVDVDYSTIARLEADQDEAPAGQIVTLTASHAPIAGASAITSRYPQLGVVFRYAIDADARLGMESAYMGPDGVQRHRNDTILAFDTKNAPGADAQGRVTGEIIGVSVGLGGAEVRFLDGVPFAPNDTQGVTFGFPLAFSWDITNPFTCPPVPILAGAINPVCKVPPPISYDLFELGIRTPRMDTPAPANFDAGLDPVTQLPLVPKRNELGADGALTSTSPSGVRTWNGGLLSDLRNFRIKDILVDDSRLDTDYARVDMDIDGVLWAMLTGGAPLAPSPLGGNFEVGETFGTDPNTGRPIRPLSIEANLLDLDLANFFHLDQELRFEPRLQVDLHFSTPVLARDDPSQAFVSVSAWTLPVGPNGTASLEIVQPPGGVSITPVWSLRDNRFTNTTRWLYTFGYQQSFLELQIGGLVWQLVGGILGFDLDFAASQLSTFAAPAQMGVSGGVPYGLAGFGDVVGSGLVVRDAPPPPGDADGDGVPDAADDCPFAQNPDQLDRGGIGTGSAPDGVGDACQCGDVNGDGSVTLADALAIQRAQLSPPTAVLALPERCDVGGSTGCSLTDALIIRRALLSPPVASVAARCAPGRP